MSWNPLALLGQKGTKRQRGPPLTNEEINSLFELIQKNTPISLQQVLNAVAFREIDFSYFSSEGNSLLLSVIKKIGENYDDDLHEKLNMCISLADNLNLKHLPDNIKIGGNLWLSDTGIEDLPKNLKLKNVSLNNTPLAKKYKNDRILIRKAYPNIAGDIFI